MEPANTPKKKRKPPSNAWQKGQSGNPVGRPPMTHAERIVKKLSKSEFIEVSNLLLRNSREDLERMLAGPGLPMFQELLISMYLKMGETGDYDAYDKHLNRLIGKVADEVKLNVKPTIIRRRNGEQVILGGEEVNEDEGNGNE